MKARISAGWSHDTSHFQFLRQTPVKQVRIPFVADRRERVELRDAVIGTLAFVGLVAALATAPWWLS